MGRAELIRARARAGMGDKGGDALAAERAVVALSSGFGPDNPLTRQAEDLRTSLKP